MFKLFRGQRPDVTPAQLAAVLVAGVPAVATLLSTFGIYELSQAQQDALAGVLTWSAVLAGLLIGGDATLRSARNVADAKRDVAALAGAAGAAAPVIAPADEEVDLAASGGLPSDEEEFAEETEIARLNGHKADDPDLVGVGT
jgi:hypothetical protein